MSSEEFKGYARIRNGAETVPSNLRRNHYFGEDAPHSSQYH